MRKGILILAVLVVALAGKVEAFGPKGHAMVGAIADRRLAGKPVGVEVANLLDGLTLEQAALLPDSIKAWDRANPKSANTFHLPDHPEIEEQLLAFFRENPPKNREPGQMPPNHHWFHYTDVPVTGKATYASGKTGRNDYDVVQMITYCSKVLKGTIGEDNPRKITKPIAVILLAHFVGDIHQPLHVGAVYFDDKGNPVNPDDTGSGLPDHGGNTLTLILHDLDDHGRGNSHFKLHSYWDGNAVNTAFGMYVKEIQQSRKGTPRKITDIDISRWLARREPPHWKLPATVALDQWSTHWADQILPIAREAHERLEFKNIVPAHDKKTAGGFAIEKTDQAMSYRDWAGEVLHDSIHRAGWRLAALLESALE